MKNVLVTGSAGFIGSNLVHRLLEIGGYNIVGLDTLNDYYDVSLKLENLHMDYGKDNYEFIMADIRNDNHMHSVFKKYEFDCVIHLAAQPGVEYSVNHPVEVYNTNIIGFDNVIRHACRNGVRHVVYASSSSIYGDGGILKSPYAVSKKTNELQAATYAELYNYTKFTGLRFFTVYGRNVRPDLAMSRFIKSIRNGEKITAYGDGSQSRDFTYVGDVVETIIRIIESDRVWKNEVFDVGYGESVSVNRLIELIGDKLGKKPIVEYADERKCDVKSTLSSTDKLYEWFGYKPTTDIKTGVGIICGGKEKQVDLD